LELFLSQLPPIRMATAASSGVVIPETVTQWTETAREFGVSGTIDQLGSQVKVGSASKFQFNHFLGLRVLYKFEKQRTRAVLPDKIIKQFPVPPKMSLDKTTSWNDYLTEVQTFAGAQADVAESCVPERLGPFVNVWLYQKHIILGDKDYADMSKLSMVSPVAGRTRGQKIRRAVALATPTPAPKSRVLPKMMEDLSLYGKEAEDGFEDASSEDSDEENPDDSSQGRFDLPTPDDPHDDDFNTPGLNARGQPIKDEQTVNVFLLAFLSAITATTVPFHTRWLAERNAMVYQRKVRYVARTDGYLRDRGGQSYGLIEVKPRLRIDSDASIRIQESAQMAAWLTQKKEESHDPYQECR